MMLALMAVALFACLGAASDFGRMFNAKHEAQVFADASALAAAAQLDGTKSGASNPVSAVDNNANKWNFGSQAFSGASGPARLVANVTVWRGRRRFAAFAPRELQVRQGKGEPDHAPEFHSDPGACDQPDGEHNGRTTHDHDV